MTQEERRCWLIGALLEERPDEYAGVRRPEDEPGQRRLLRALLNLRPSVPADEALLRVQDEYLAEALRRRGVTDADALQPLADGLCLWRGDITTLKVNAIVNAANSALLGCFCPNHGCIDNAIHTFAGIQLRLACAALMADQGREEPTGTARCTPAFNLPSRYVLHTVGPIVRGPVTQRHRAQLADCYRACLDLAARQGARSIAFCCISTGEYHFPNELAARIAVDTVRGHEAVRAGQMRVVFNVFQQRDEEIYRRTLS